MSRREKKPIDAGPGWLATYGDLVTLLLAFFVMMFAVSQVQEQKFEAFLSGLGHFDNSAAEPGVFLADPRSAPQVNISPNISPVDRKGPGGSDDEEKQQELEEIEQRVSQAIEASALRSAVEVYVHERGIAAAISTDDLLFASGSASLTPAGAQLMAGIADVLRPLPYSVTVEGHTDSVPLNRGGYTNWNLSTDRAVSVVHNLTQAHAIRPSRFTAIGHAEQRPRAKGDTPADRARNRRVEIVIHARPSDSGDGSSPPTTVPVRPGPVDVVTGAGIPRSTTEQKDTNAR